MLIRWLSWAGVAMLAVAGIFWWKAQARMDDPLPPPPPVEAGALLRDATPAEPPVASERSREEKRFDRYDKDRNGLVSREEYFVSRRKAFAKLDADRDGRLAFDEWAARTNDRFAGADADRSATLTRAEFQTTKPKRRTAARCACPSSGNDTD